MTYLFFDTECANCKDKYKKLCSFGYILVDTNFNVIESNDFVMNPETQFDWYLFKKNSDCRLAYTKEYFLSCPTFPKFYESIKKLIENPYTKVIGYGLKGDLNFLNSTCIFYKLPKFKFDAYYLHDILKKDNIEEMGLLKLCEYYKIDTRNLLPHKSQDDAKMTMLAAKAYCEKNKISLGKLTKILLPKKT